MIDGVATWHRGWHSWYLIVYTVPPIFPFVETDIYDMGTGEYIYQDDPMFKNEWKQAHIELSIRLMRIVLLQTIKENGKLSIPLDGTYTSVKQKR